MTKSPEEYFEEHDFSLADEGTELSAVEQAFVEKYMGLDAEKAMASVGLTPATSKVARQPDMHPEMASETSITAIMREAPSLQMVAFLIGKQEFLVPTLIVQEVIRAIPIVRLPTAPPQVAGAVSLRGKITPLVHLRSVLEVASPRQLEDDKFFIVCRRQGLQFGLVVESIHTIYRIPQEDIDWSVETTLGGDVEHIAGLVKLNDMLVGIVNVDSVIDSIIEK